MAFTETMTQALAIPVADLPPVNRAANTATNVTGWICGPIDMSLFKRAFAKCSVGVTVGASCTATMTFLASNTSNTSCTLAGVFAQVSSGPIANVTANMAGTIEMRADQMPSGTRYLTLLVSTNCAMLFQAEIFGGEASYKPASSANANSTLLVQSVASI